MPLLLRRQSVKRHALDTTCATLRAPVPHGEGVDHVPHHEAAFRNNNTDPSDVLRTEGFDTADLKEAKGLMSELLGAKG